MGATHTAGEALAAGLRRHGVSIIFGQAFPVLTQHVGPRYGLRQVGFRTENAAGAMADGYARVSHKIGVVTAQGGPGATLLVPPLAEALKASIPVLALVEESPLAQADRNAFQELDHLKLFDSCAKWVRRLTTAERIDEYLDAAVVAATSGRCGPAVLILPSDVLAQPIPVAPTRTQHLGGFPLYRMLPEQETIRKAAELINAAERPVIFAGGGVHLSGASVELEALSTLAGIPVATTNMGKGSVDERSPLSLGVFGNCMGPGSRTHGLEKYVREADLVLLVGTRTNANGTDNWSLLPEGGRSIHIDVDGQEIGRNYESLGLVGDAKAVLGGLISALEAIGPKPRSEWRTEIQGDLSRALQRSDEYRRKVGKGSEGAVRPEYVMELLDETLRPDDIVVMDASFSTNWVCSYLTSRRAGSRFVTPRGLAGLGWGFPMALGAKLARPEARVFCIVGDGGFAHCWAELETARRMGIKVVTLVLNNQILGYQKHGEDMVFGMHSDASELGPVDHARIAEACGCFGVVVSSPRDLAGALKAAVDEERPALVDVIAAEEAVPPLSMFGDWRPRPSTKRDETET
jgi:acetolactate synthase-1/2/3 large subunit